MRIPFLRRSRHGTSSDMPTPTPAATAPIVMHAVTGSSGHASLANIIGRRTPILWVEAVAIVEGLTNAVALMADDPKNAAVPDLEDTFLTADGRIELRSTRSAHVGVQSLARTLHVLVTGEQVPPPLRLFIAKWIETPDAHAVQEFGEALAYFVRPDGSGLIRTVYERFLAMPELPAGAVIPKPEIEPPKPPKPARRSVPKPVLVLGSVAVVLGAVFLAWTTVGNRVGDGKSGSVAKVIADGRRLLGSARDQLAQKLGIGTTSAPETAKTTEARTAPNPEPRPRVRATAPAPELPVKPIPEVRRSFDPGYVPFQITSEDTVAAAPVAVSPANDSPEPAAALVPDIVYTMTDTSVEPPQLVYPHLPRVPSGGPDVNSMEVVVAEDGSVERVRLISAARRMTDMMLLSGAKSWRFAPALRDGQPVRYRMTINWQATQ
jgi:hypothetical protein